MKVMAIDKLVALIIKMRIAQQTDPASAADLEKKVDEQLMKYQQMGMV